MAAAEVRAVWQRTVNRYFVQEDAKRAPKIACCQSSSPISKQVDAETTDAGEGGDRPAVDFLPSNRKPSFSNIPSDTIWWLHHQPCYGLPKGLTCERLNALDSEEGIMKDDSMKSDDNLSRETHETSPFSNKKRSCRVSPEMYDSIPVNRTGQQSLGARQEMNCMINEGAKAPNNMDIAESYKFVDMDCAASSGSKEPNELGLAIDSPWIENSKPEPWWHTADQEELASFVATKSHDHIMNCDLPPPRKMHIRTHPYLTVRCLQDEVSTSCVDCKVSPCSTLNPDIVARAQPLGCPDSGQTCQRQHEVVDGCFRCGSNQAYGRSSYSSSRKTSGEAQNTTNSDPARAQLLEALCHSQTRAREAEKAAGQLHAEKEHIIKLVFRQAYQLFAYRQWFQLLQLETLYLQIKNNDQPISTIFPVGVVLPWNHHRGKRLRKNWHKALKARQGKRGHPKHDIKKYSLVFALGLGLVGAGLLLGWTVGWMLPLF